MPRTKDSADIPNRLLKAGRDLFWRDGYNATGILQITETAGVPKGSFYNHFPSKEAFAVAVIGQYGDHLQRSWDAMVAAAPPGAQATIAHVFNEMIAWHERAPDRPGCLMGNLAAEITLSSDLCREALQTAHLAWRGRLAGLIREGQDKGELRRDLPAGLLSGLIWDAWEGALLRMKLERSAEPVRQSMTLLLGQLLWPHYQADPHRAA
ncbi:TetR family transcriptional regulator C-terminal domain-containing protein [Tistrella mobilis]|uniref:TetR/AcrR family transcriptional regulator n=1 Tax=Tistrella mobilis TaxID=171437 RepID=UPI0035565209